MFYPRLVDAFKEQISSAVEKAICQKLGKGILKVDSILQAFPKEVQVDDNTSFDITFAEKPLLSNSSIGLKINGLFRESKSSQYLSTTPKLHLQLQLPVQILLKCLE